YWKDSPALDFLIKNNHNEMSVTDFVGRKWWQAPESMKELKEFAGKLAKLDLTVLWKEITTADTAEIGHTVKETIPEMTPPNVVHHIKWLDSKRLRRFSQKSREKVTDFNAYPHPFP